jgi:hypothetical protein
MKKFLLLLIAVVSIMTASAQADTVFSAKSDSIAAFKGDDLIKATAIATDLYYVKGSNSIYAIIKNKNIEYTFTVDSLRQRSVSAGLHMVYYGKVNVKGTIAPATLINSYDHDGNLYIVYLLIGKEYSFNFKINSIKDDYEKQTSSGL